MFGFPDAPAPSMGIRARRLRRRKAGGLHGAPGFEGAFEDEDDFVSSKPTSRYAEHRAFVERESARRRRKGAAMDWLIALVGFLISALATCVAFVVHLAFPVKDDGSVPRRAGTRDGPRGDGAGRKTARDDFFDADDATRDAFAALHLDARAPDVTLEDVAAAYRRLARKHHPDKNGGSEASSAAMQRVNAARNACVAEVKRRRRARDDARAFVRAYASEDDDGGGSSGFGFARGDGFGFEARGSDEDAFAETEEAEAEEEEEERHTRESDGAFEEARRQKKQLRARRAFMERFLDISARDRRARSRTRATFVTALGFVCVVVAVLAARACRRRADATSVAAEWFASGIVVALGALATATH